MNIVVILRLVPDPLEELPLVDGALDHENVALHLNEFDDHALEEAVLVKEESDATVIALSLEAHGKRILQTALARGADRAVSLVGDYYETLSSRAMAPVYAEALRQLRADLVLTGVQTPADIFGQLVPCLAVALDRPQVNGVTSVQCVGDRLHVVQEYGGGRSATLSLSPQAVLGIQASRQPPRYVSGSRLRQASQTAEIERRECATPCGEDLALVAGFRVPSVTGSAEMLGDDPESAASRLLEVLSERGLAASAAHG